MSCFHCCTDSSGSQILLTAEINHFLACAARWTTRWFNKPKFHIFLHLPEHIRRFGPAILFATEAFESFNAIIRAKSVHSNRHAPSRDIARAFAQGNRIRHLLSGGLFMRSQGIEMVASTTQLREPTSRTQQAVSPVSPDETGAVSMAGPLVTAISQDKPAASKTQPVILPLSTLSRDKNDWTRAGRGPLSLVLSPNTITQYLGLDNKKRSMHGANHCLSYNEPLSYHFQASASPINKPLDPLKLPLPDRSFLDLDQPLSHP